MNSFESCAKSNDIEHIVKTAIEKFASNGYANMTQEEFIKVLSYSIDQSITKSFNKAHNDMLRY